MYKSFSENLFIYYNKSNKFKILYISCATQSLKIRINIRTRMLPLLRIQQKISLIHVFTKREARMQWKKKRLPLKLIASIFVETLNGARCLNHVNRTGHD